MAHRGVGDGRAMRSLVTGAAGFIGSTLVDRLLADGHQVIGIDNFTAGTVANLKDAMSWNERSPGQFRLICLDVQAPELAGVIAGANPDIIFHLAAQMDPQVSVLDPQFDARSNVLGTINLCEASRRSGVRRIVYAGCREARYGIGAGRPPEGSGRTNPVSPHGVAKVAAEMYLCAYAEMYDLAPLCLALGSVYGPRQNHRDPGNAIAALASAMIAGGSQIRGWDNIRASDYVYIDDAVDALVRAGHAPVQITGMCDISTGTPTRCPLEWTPLVDLPDGIARTVRWLTDLTATDPTSECEEQSRKKTSAERISHSVDLVG